MDCLDCGRKLIYCICVNNEKNKLEARISVLQNEVKRIISKYEIDMTRMEDYCKDYLVRISNLKDENVKLREIVEAISDMQHLVHCNWRDKNDEPCNCIVGKANKILDEYK